MIADIAHVSRTTVRRVMRNEPYVKEEVRQRVQAVIDHYHYKPNSVGAALVSRKTSIKIGVICFSATDALYEELRNGSLQAAQDYQEYGIEILLRSVDDQGGAQSIVDAIHELDSLGIRGLAITAFDVPEIQNALLSLRERIPIVTYNTEISNIDELCFVGQDSIQSGRTAAALMSGMLPKQGDVAIVANSTSVSAVAKRIQGFRKKLSENSELNVCKILETGSGNTRSYEQIKTLFQENEAICGIYIASGFGSEGVCQALEEGGRTNVRIVAHDLLPYTVKNLHAGKIDFSIDQELFRQGYLPVEILVKFILLKEQPPAKRIDTKIDIKTSENV